MTNIFYSSQVCEQLARELVTEQAELLKHETLVKEIKAKLVEGKKQLIRKLIDGKTFLINGKKRTVLLVEFDEYQDNMRVELTMGLDPDEIDLPSSMTRKEKEFLMDYKDYLLIIHEDQSEWACIDALEIANELKSLKHGIYLSYGTVWEIDFSNATTPGFFEQSGLEVRDEGGCYMLEDLNISNS